jgi:hypothetical protein
VTSPILEKMAEIRSGNFVLPGNGSGQPLSNVATRLSKWR